MSEPEPEIFQARDLGGELHPILPTAIDPDAANVLRRLHQGGHRAYLVGGCVRDLLLGGTPKDFDIATSARPRQVKKLFRNARIIGRRFRLVHVMFRPNKQIEVSTFRRDPNDERGEPSGAYAPEPEPESELETPDFGDEPSNAPRDDAGRGAEADAGGGASARDADDGGDEDEDLLIREDNVYGSEAEDAVRRDFTINGLFYDVQSESVLDYVGGVADLRRRTLRTIGDASRRIREDPVRILRAVKFSTRLGLALDPLLASAMAEHHEDLVKSAAPRVFEEILRMLGGVVPERSIEVLIRLGVMHVLFPELGLRPHGDEEDLRRKRLLARLAAVSAIDRGRRSFPTAIYVAILFYDEVLARLVGSGQPIEGPHPPPSQALDDFLRPVGQRCRMAKRDTARVRAMFLALRRIDPELAEPRSRKRRRRGGLNDFLRREFFEDALMLMRLVATAEGRDLAAVAEWEQKRDEAVHGPQSQPSRPRPQSHRDEPRRAPHEPDEPHESHGPAPAGATPEDEEPAATADAASGHGRRRRRRRRRGGAGASPGRDADLGSEPDSEPA